MVRPSAEQAVCDGSPAGLCVLTFPPLSKKPKIIGMSVNRFPSQFFGIESDINRSIEESRSCFAFL